MPESAEIRLTTDYLNCKLKNKMIIDWKMLNGQYNDHNPKGYDNFYNNLPLLIESVKCKGKFIYFTLINEHTKIYILHHMRLTGKWQDKKDPFCRWYIELENNEKIWFKNVKCLSTLEFTYNQKDLDATLDNLGPDILTSDFNLKKWKSLIVKHKNKNITSFLVDQSIISGIGNYLKAETLYYAEISPMRRVSSLKECEVEKLFEGIRIISRISYNKGGIGKYVGNGTFKEDLKVYCCDNAQKDKTADGRLTYWDPDVQT